MSDLDLKPGRPRQEADAGGTAFNGIVAAVTIEGLDDLRDQFELTSQQWQVVLRTAANKTARWGRTQFRRRISDALNLTVKDRNRAIDYRTAKGGDLTAEIIVTRYRIPLRAYKPRQTAQGLLVQYGRIGAAQLIPHAFLADMPARPGQADQGDAQTDQAVWRDKHLPTKGINRQRGFRLSRYLHGPLKGKTRKLKLGLTPAGVAWGLAIRKLWGPTVLSQFVSKNGLTDLAHQAIGDLDAKFMQYVQSQIQYVLSGKASKLVDDLAKSDQSDDSGDTRADALPAVTQGVAGVNTAQDLLGELNRRLLPQ